MFYNTNFDDNYTLRIHHIISSNPNLLLNNPTVNAIGFSTKIINNQNTNIPCLKFFTHKKLPYKYIEPNYRIPQYINGVLTDVIPTGTFNLYAGEDKVSYAGLGVQQATNKTQYGTITYPVTDKNTRLDLFLLTCSHIFDKSTLGTAKNILFGSIPSKKHPSVGEHTAKLQDFTELKWAQTEEALKSTPTNKLDAAMAYVGNNTSSTRTLFLAPYLKIGTQQEILNLYLPHPPRLNNDVWFITSNDPRRVLGSIDSIDVLAKTIFNGKFYAFEKQILVRLLSGGVIPGDSGALGVHTTDNSPFGMLISADISGLAIFTPLKRVLDKFNIVLVKPGENN